MLLPSAPPSLLTPRFSCILILCVVLGLFVHSIFFLRRPQDLSTVEFQPGKAGSLIPERHYLNRLVNRYGLTNETSWLAWRVQHTEEFSEWTSVADVHHDFESYSPKIIDVANPDQLDLRARKRMELPVSVSPVPGTVQASDLLIGVSTTYERLVAQNSAKLKSWARFLTNGRGQTNGASLIVMLAQATEQQVEQLDTNLAARGIDAYVTTTDQPMSLARRYYELSRILKSFGASLAANGQEKRWFGLIEDEIFFPNLSYLLDRLFSYNTANPHYIGLPSERADWEMVGDTITTYGGGAVFVTQSVVGRISQLPCFRGEDAGAPVRSKNWDVLLQDCLKQHSDMKMHVLPGFYSPKENMDAPNLDSYEMGTRPLVLRRPEERHAVDVNKAHLVTNVCGEGCFMQRYLFHDNWVLINGISISEYPKSLSYRPRDTKSPNNDDAGKSSSSPPLPRHILLDEGATNPGILSWTGRRNTWKLLDSTAGKDQAVWQAYVKRGVENAPLDVDKMDSVIVLIWEKQKLRRGH